MLELFGLTLTAIEKVLRAEKQVLSEGHAVSRGPDHSVRLTAANRYLELASTGRQVPAQEIRQNTLTIQELERFHEFAQERRQEHKGHPLTASKAAQSARRVRMTEAVVAGKSITNIARSEKRSRPWVSRELASAESHQFIAELVDYHKAHAGAIRSDANRDRKSSES